MVRMWWASEVEIKLAGDFLHRQISDGVICASTKKKNFCPITNTYPTEKDGISHHRNLLLLERTPAGTGWLRIHCPLILYACNCIPNHSQIQNLQKPVS